MRRYHYTVVFPNDGARARSFLDFWKAIDFARSAFVAQGPIGDVRLVSIYAGGSTMRKVGEVGPWGLKDLR